MQALGLALTLDFHPFEDSYFLYENQPQGVEWEERIAYKHGGVRITPSAET